MQSGSKVGVCIYGSYVRNTIDPNNIYVSSAGAGAGAGAGSLVRHPSRYRIVSSYSDKV